MVHYDPVELDTATSPATPRRPPPSKTINPARIDDATQTVGGKMSPADKTLLDGVPAAIAAAAGAVDAAAEHVANKNAANGYPGLTAGKFVQAARLSRSSVRNLHLVDGRIDYRPSALVRRAHPIPAWSFYCGDESTGLGSSSGVRAGLVAIAPNNAGVAGGPIHPDAGSFPFMTLFTSVDENGYPAYLHKRMNSSNAMNDSGEDGYPNGLLVTAGAFQRGDGYNLTVRGKMKNSHSGDAFVEFAIEPNHARGVFNGTSRARLLSGPIGLTWTGWLDFVCEMRWRYQKGAHWSVDALMSWYRAGYGLEHEAPCQASVTAGVNLRTTLALLSHQFRVDNIANLNAYNGTYQGLGTLELVAMHIDLQPVVGNR